MWSTRGGPPAADDDLDHIEPVAVAPSTESEPPDLGHSGQHLSLAPADRFPPRPEAVAPAGLHLDERHQRTAADDQIEVVVANPESVRLDPPAGRREHAARGGLAVEAEAMAGVARVGG